MKIVVIFSIIYLVVAEAPCIPRSYGHDSFVCVCHANYCDDVPRPQELGVGQFIKFTSSKEGLRFHSEADSFSQEPTVELSKIILINRNITYQKIHGFGGAFTDSTGINIKALPNKAQEKLINSYFSPKGLEYNLCRVPIGGTDFSTHAYSYDDGDIDPGLKNFALASEDFEYKIPFIKAALNLTDNNLRLFATAWGAPKWMKTNGKWGGFLGFLKKDFYQTWADYHLKFLESYDENGIQFWGLTLGNEPSNTFIPFAGVLNDVGWWPPSVSDYITENLGPTIRKSKYSDIKIMAHDDQRYLLPWLLEWELNDESKAFIDGIAFHWYSNFLAPAWLLKKTHERLPDKFILATEASNGGFPSLKHVQLGSWARGEKYSNDIIEDFNNWVTGWVDWNMALDLRGGPVYIKNFLDAPIIVNSTAGEFYKNPTFYNLGHFSKFIPRDSIRIHLTKIDNKVPAVAFKRPDDGITLVILNKKNKDVKTTIRDPEKGLVNLSLPKKSITTIVY